ncbi:hypothetical protein [Prevotella sp. P2-180]|uniref:hypothetical protein n=1 Tax=Prevotella sp. P2-180 TaxID=2024224 RepID=UPI000BCB26D7|nr:hypothetical protein [Prevotella sp. P2-180]OYP67045.1 hypothetical protein CIK98_06515 [Prevotella sp. P2-180]
MEFILSVVAMLVAVIAMLAINHIIYKREKILLEINEKYKRFYNRSLDDCVELKELVVSTDNEKEAYKNAIYDCIENFNRVYSNTKLHFDEDKCAFVIEDIDVNDSLPTEEEITQQNENNNENK